MTGDSEAPEGSTAQAAAREADTVAVPERAEAAEATEAAIPNAIETETRPAAAEAEPSAPAQALRRRKAWSTTAKVVTAVVSVVSFVTGVISVIPIIFRNTSNFDALTVAVSPYPESRSEWALPRGADVSDFPVGPDDGCTEAQRAWLDAHGTPIVTQIVLDLRNTADEGPMLSLKDFGFTGERSPADEVAVRVVCDTAPLATTQLRAARLDTGTEGATAMYSAAAFGATTDGLPDTPAAWNLAPGETGQFIVQLYGSSAVEGGISALVLSGKETRVMEFSGTPVVVVPLVEEGASYLRAGSSGLACVTESGDHEPLPCEVGSLLS